MIRKTIKIKKYSDIIEEYIAGGVITPGHLVALNSDGEVIVHATEAGVILPMFALEDELQGKGIDDAYKEDDRVQVWIPGRGDEVYALLAANESVNIGDYLVSKGGGTLKKLASDTVADSQIIGFAVEAAGSVNVERVIVKII
ncbi:MAG: hypothetical protein RBR39_10010 [Proteiniphilum sp.]|nr:hypothetical protein [Proteiniphilum sp.]